MQNSNDLYKCRVCGAQHYDMPWGPDGRTPSCEICECCGVEFGYEDCNEVAIQAYIERWKRGEEPMAQVTYEDWLAKKQQEEKGDSTST